jgi:hypothetical protein
MVQLGELERRARGDVGKIRTEAGGDGADDLLVPDLPTVLIAAICEEAKSAAIAFLNSASAASASSSVAGAAFWGVADLGSFLGGSLGGSWTAPAPGEVANRAAERVTA